MYGFTCFFSLTYFVSKVFNNTYAHFDERVILLSNVKFSGVISPVTMHLLFEVNFHNMISSLSTKISTESFLLISSALLSSIGITIRPNLSTFRTMPVDFFYLSS